MRLRLLKEGTNHSHSIAHVLDRALYSEGFFSQLNSCNTEELSRVSDLYVAIKLTGGQRPIAKVASRLSVFCRQLFRGRTLLGALEPLQ